MGRLRQATRSLPLMVAAVVAVMLVVFAAGAVFRLRAAYTLESLRHLAAEADQVNELGEALLIGLLDAESNARAFVLTRRPVFQDAYKASRADAEATLRQLRQAANEFGLLAGDMDKVQNMVGARLALLDGGVQTADAGSEPTIQSVIGSDAGRNAMGGTRAQIERLMQHAAEERDRQSAEARANERFTRIAVTAGAITGVLLLGGAAVALLVGRARLLLAQQKLQAQAALWQATVENLQDGVAVFDAQGGLLQWNRNLAPLTNFPAGLLQQAVPFHRFAAELAKWDPPVLASSLAQATVEARAGGRVLEVSCNAMPDGGQMLTFGDITRRVEAEAIARQAHKMDVLGQLTGGVAHDFNNLLQVISANLDLMSNRLRTDPASSFDWLRGRLAAAMEGVNRGARLTRHLLAFARRQPLTPEPVNVAQLLAGLEDMLRRTLGSVIAVEQVIAGGLWTLLADAQQLENAILNLAINARDAMASRPPGQARLTIEARNASLDDGYCATNPDIRPGHYVMIAVSDSGCGMTQEQISRAVEPFYTTKPEGQGTGLGLSMVYGFAKQSGGHLKLYSEPGRGTTARLYIPRTIAPAASPDKQLASPARGLGEMVLLVEDDPSVRAAAALALLGLGYRVEEAETADAAMAKLERGLRPALIFSDVVMPGALSAPALAARATAMIPDVAIVFASGYTENAVVHNGLLDPDVHLISKPWRIEDLASRLRLALDMGRRPPPANTAQRVLLVEDDALIRALTADMLAELGYQVVQAAEAGTALGLLDGVDLIITDLGLGQTDGLALAASVRARLPRIPVIVASGQAEQDSGASGLLWLSKPFDKAALRSVLEQAQLAGYRPLPAAPRPAVQA